MILLYFLFCLILSLAYLATISKIYSGWTALKEVQVPADYIPSKFMSIIVAARNEEHDIRECIESILAVDYPLDLYEVIMVDDHSDDETLRIMNSFKDARLKILFQKDGVHGKKAALSLAIAKSKGEIIVTTDADCIVRKNWLRVISYVYDTQKIKLATAPVVFNRGSNVVENYQVLDLAGMMAVTASGIFNKTYYLANGANMSFTREMFDEQNGFEGNKQYASGDDMFLIHKLAKENPEAVAFLKTTAGTVTTESESTFKNLLQQRKRWATKSKAYSDRSLQILLVFIFVFNLVIVGNVFLSFWLGVD